MNSPQHSRRHFPSGSTGDYIVKALQTRGIPFRYLEPQEITSPRAAKKVFISFAVNRVNYLYGSCGRIYVPQPDRVPGPLMDEEGARVARQKKLTHTLLRARGINVPNGVAISRLGAEIAEAYFSAIVGGCPNGVRLKPLAGNKGRHLYANICDMQSFRREFRALSKSFSAIWVEEAVKGG